MSLELGNESLQSLKNKTEQWLNDPHNTDPFIVLYHTADFSGPNGTVSAEKLKLLGDYIDYLQGTGRVQFTTLDRSWTTTDNGTPTNNGAVASSSSEAATPRGAPAVLNVGFAGEWTVFAVLGAILAFSLVSSLTIRLSKNRNRPKG